MDVSSSLSEILGVLVRRTRVLVGNWDGEMYVGVLGLICVAPVAFVSVDGGVDGGDESGLV